MNKINKIGFVFFLFSLFLIPSVMAQPPGDIYIEYPIESTSLQISVSTNDHHIVNTEYIFYFHVYNSTSFIKNSSVVDCVFGGYNHDYGSETYSITPIETENSWIVLLNESAMSREGVFEYILYCNSTEGEAGFHSDIFHVNQSGVEEPDPSFFIGLIFIPVALAFILIFGSGSMSEDHNVLRIFMFLLSISCVLISLWFSTILVVEFYGLYALQEAIATTTFIIGSVYFVLIAYFIFYAIFKTKEFFFNKKKDKDKGNLEY
jgi:hypothetical protein